MKWWRQVVTTRRPIRYLSPSIALKREFSTVFLTVIPEWPDKKPIYFRYLQMPETIEWE